jgi:hypothetical protein
MFVLIVVINEINKEEEAKEKKGKKKGHWPWSKLRQ